jgi:hypothetical protein
MATKTMDAATAYAHVEAEGKAKAKQEVRRLVCMEIGQVVRQGDIYIHRVADDHARGPKAKTRQLAIGSTQGSRHIAEAPAEVYEGTTRPEWCAENTFLGPVVVCPEPCTVTHPEHAHVRLPKGTFQITHQMDAASMRRVQD